MGQAIERPPGRPVDVLLVEDNPGDVALMRISMKRAALENRLHVVRDGADALAYLQRLPPHEGAPRPDLVLLDLNLPKLDGREVLQRIKQEPDLSSIPVVVLSSSQAAEDISQCYALHASAFVTKPVGLQGLMGIVEAIDGFWLNVVRYPPTCDGAPRTGGPASRELAPEPGRAASGGPPESEARAADGPPVLVVDDDPGHRALLGAWLRGTHPVVEAVRGEDALALAVRPRAVLLDLELPGMSGEAVARSLREIHGPSLRIVGLSGHVDEKRQRRAASAGFDALVEKVDLGRERLLALIDPPGADPVRPRGATGVDAHDPARALLESRFVTGLADRLNALRAAIGAGHGGAASAPRPGTDTARRLAHNLAGSSAAYGFPDLAQAARELMVVLGPAEDALTAGAEIRRRLDAIEREIQCLAGPVAVTPPEGP